MDTEIEVVGQLPPMHPGEVLREEFMVPHGLTAYALAKACGVPRTRIERIAREEIGITPDTAIRLEQMFGSSAVFWLGLQADYDMETTRPKIAEEVANIKRWEPEADDTADLGRAMTAGRRSK